MLPNRLRNFCIRIVPILTFIVAVSVFIHGVQLLIKRVCLWFLDYRSLFRGGYELVTFRHVQLGLAAFSGWRALEALRELLVPPELDSPVRRWTRWIPLTWLSLPMCLASLLAMLYFPEALAEAGRSRPTSSY